MYQKDHDGNLLMILMIEYDYEHASKDMHDGVCRGNQLVNTRTDKILGLVPMNPPYFIICMNLFNSMQNVKEMFEGRRFPIYP